MGLFSDSLSLANHYLTTAKNSDAQLSRVHDELSAHDQFVEVKQQIDKMSLKMVQPKVYGGVNKTEMPSLKWFDLTTE